MQAIPIWAIGACAALACCSSARGELIESGATGFTSQLRERFASSPDAVWQALVQLPRWWSGAHTYSGQAANLSLDARAGGCWCERWADGQSVEHGTVLLALPGRALRLRSNLGPLQDLPVTGVLTFAISNQDGQTLLRMTYRVAGPAEAGLQKLAQAVDGVLGEQYKRLKALAETGKPE